MSVHACCQRVESTQLDRPLPQARTRGFQNRIDPEYPAGASAWYWWHEPFESLFITAQALVLAGVSPKEIACCACTFGVETQRIHLTAQFGCFACAEIIHVSAQPVAPSRGIRSLTGALPAWSVFVWYGQDAPTSASPFLNRSISSAAEAQYFFTSGFCFLSRSTAALNWASVSSYGSLIPSDGFV